MTPHFSAEEFVTTLHPHIQKAPSPKIHNQGVVFAAATLEPWRYRLGALAGRTVPVGITSWYRGKRLNTFVGGVSTSLHLEGLAADCIPRGVARLDAWKVLIEMAWAGLPITEAVIYVQKAHIHVAYDFRREMGVPEFLFDDGQPGPLVPYAQTHDRLLA